MITHPTLPVGFSAIERTDLQLLHKWRNNEFFRQYFREYREISFVQLEDWFTHLQTDQHRLMFKVVDILHLKLWELLAPPV